MLLRFADNSIHRRRHPTLPSLVIHECLTASAGQETHLQKMQYEYAKVLERWDSHLNVRPRLERHSLVQLQSSIRLWLRI